MFAYLLALFGVLAHAVPHPWLPFTAVGGSLLYFGARRKLWQGIFPVAALAFSDYYLTSHVYGFPFAARDYLVTWAWYAAVIALGAILLRSKVSVGRVVSGTLLASTSFFAVSNYAVWVTQLGMYPHTLRGLMTCYAAGLPFYRNDLVSTAIVAGMAFGISSMVHKVQTAEASSAIGS
jgi:hypothetical protein